MLSVRQEYLNDCDREAGNPPRFAEGMTVAERADAILESKRRVNIPHPTDKGQRIVGFVVDEDTAGLGLGLLALDEIARRALFEH